MKKNTLIVCGIIAAIAIIGIIAYANRSTEATPPGTVATTTPSGTTDTGGTTVQGSAPVVTTGAIAIPTDTTVVVSGSVIPKGSLTNYWYEIGVTPSLGSKTMTQVLGSGYSAISAPFYITELTKDTTYYFRLVAENAFGRSGGSVYSFQTNHALPTVVVGSLPTVRTVVANNITRTGASLNGEVTANKVVTTYWFEYGKTVNLGNTSALVTVQALSIKSPATVSLTNLDSATTYYFRLNAQNQFGTVNGAILNFKTDSPKK